MKIVSAACLGKTVTSQETWTGNLNQSVSQSIMRAFLRLVHSCRKHWFCQVFGLLVEIKILGEEQKGYLNTCIRNEVLVLKASQS